MQRNNANDPTTVATAGGNVESSILAGYPMPPSGSSIWDGVIPDPVGPAEFGTGLELEAA